MLLEAQKKHETVVKTFVELQLGEFMKEHQATLARWIRARQTTWRDAALVRHDDDFANTNAMTIRDKHHELLVEKKGLEEKDRTLQSTK